MEQHMTIHEVLADVKSDRVKKIIMDCDAGNEIDDQYAIAYALGCDKLDVIGISAVQFFNEALVPSIEAGMMESYNEILRVVKYVGCEDVPVLKGCAARVDSPDHDDPHPEIYPVDSEAVDFIIKAAHESDEIVYVIATGAVTNVVSAVAKDPTIKDKICVIWVGANCLELGAGGEFNFHQDFTGGRYLLNCGVNLILAPAVGHEGHGTQVLREGREFLMKNFPADDAANTYFRELPAEHDGEYNEKPDEWSHVFWDIGGPAILDCTEYAELSIITAPRIRGDGSYALGEDRHEIIYMEKLTPAPILDRAMDCIKKLING